MELINLYHGTSILRWSRIQLTGFLEPAPMGDEHVSFTTDLSVARYFAHCAWSTPDEDEIGMVVLKTTNRELALVGLSVEPFSSEVWGPGECDWEKEMACENAVPIEVLDIAEVFGPVVRRKGGLG